MRFSLCRREFRQKKGENEMKCAKMVLGGFVALAAAVGAMPTAEQAKKAEPLVLELMREDQEAMKSGKKTPADVAASAMELAGKADTEAEKLLLMNGAFKLYFRANEFDKSIETLQSLRMAIPDIPLTNIANIIESELHRRKNPPKGGERLYQLKDEIRLYARYTAETRKLESEVKRGAVKRTLRLELAEHYAYLGQWDQALDSFAAAGGKEGEIVKAERSGDAAAAKAAEFWWNYSTGKADELEKCFRVHAAKLYEKAIAANAITGLSKIHAERRIAEANEYGDNVFGLTFGMRHSTNVAAARQPTPATSHSTLIFKTGVKPGTVTRIKLSDNCDMVFSYCPTGSMKIVYGKGKVKQQTITRGYWLGSLPISSAQWKALMGDQKGMQESKGVAVNISYESMQKYLEILNKNFSSRLPKGYVFRFPTSAEFSQAQAAMDESPDNSFWPVDATAEENMDGKKNANGVPDFPNPWGLELLGSFGNMLYDTASCVDTEKSRGYEDGTVTGWGGRPWYEFEWQLPAIDPVLITPNGRPLVSGWQTNVWRKRCYVKPSTRIALRVCIGAKLNDWNDWNNTKFPLASNVELEMIKCPAGEFTMGYECWKRFGTPFNIESRKTHQVILTKDFMLGKFPVTYAQWHAVMGKGEKTSAEFMNTPVGNITVAEMEAFCEKLTAKFKSSLGGKVFRLPTEAEWEYASKGGRNLRALLGRGLGPYDRDKDKLEALWAKLGYKAEDHERDSSTKGSLCKWKGLPVGKFDANEWGFKDMIGNVIEVTADMVQDSRIPADWNKTTIGDLHPWSVEQRYSLIEIDPLRKGSRQVVRGGFFEPDLKMTIDRKYALPIIGFRLCVGEKLGDWNNAKPANAKKQTTSVRQLVFKTGVKPGTVTTIELADDYDMEFAYCPAGKFKMGYEGAEKIAPLRDVTISYPFWMLKRKVTPRMLWEAGVPSGAEDVTAVMHELKPFNKFISFLNKKYGEKLPKGYVFRLMTEAEYEYVSKAESKNGDPRLSWGCEGSEYKPWGIEGLFQGKKVFQDRISADKLTSDITDVCLLDYSSQPKTDPLMWCEDGKYCCLRRAPKKQLRKLVSQPRDNLEGGHLPGDEFHLVIAPSVNALNKFNCNKVEQQW